MVDIQEIDNKIVDFIKKNPGKQFNFLSRELSERGVISRRTLYGRLLKMEKNGFLKTEMMYWTNHRGELCGDKAYFTLKKQEEIDKRN